MSLAILQNAQRAAVSVFGAVGGLIQKSLDLSRAVKAGQQVSLGLIQVFFKLLERPGVNLRVKCETKDTQSCSKMQYTAVKAGIKLNVLFALRRIW